MIDSIRSRLVERPPPPASPGPTSASCSRTRSTRVVSAPVSQPALRPSSRLPSGRRCSRCASCAEPGRRAGLSGATTRSAFAVRAVSGSSTATSGGTATQPRRAMRSSPARLTPVGASRGVTTSASVAIPTLKLGARTRSVSSCPRWTGSTTSPLPRSSAATTIGRRGSTTQPWLVSVMSATKPRGAWRSRAT